MSVERLRALRDYWLEKAATAPTPEFEAEFRAYAAHDQSILDTVSRTQELIAESRALLAGLDAMPRASVADPDDA